MNIILSVPQNIVMDLKNVMLYENIIVALKSKGHVD